MTRFIMKFSFELAQKPCLVQMTLSCNPADIRILESPLVNTDEQALIIVELSPNRHNVRQLADKRSAHYGGKKEWTEWAF